MVETGRKLDERHSRSSQPENELSTALVSLEGGREGGKEKERKREKKNRRKKGREKSTWIDDLGGKKKKRRRKKRRRKKRREREKTSRSSFIVNLSIETCSSGRLERGRITERTGSIM